MAAMGLRVKPPPSLTVAAHPERSARAAMADAAYLATGEHQHLTAPLDPERCVVFWRVLERVAWQLRMTLADGYAPDFARDRVRAWLVVEQLALEPATLEALLDLECERVLRREARAA